LPIWLEFDHAIGVSVVICADGKTTGTEAAESDCPSGPTIVTLPPLPPPPPPPVPVGKPAPPVVLTVVVDVDVMQVSCVDDPTVNANHPPLGAIYCDDVVALAPSAQYAPLVAPTLVATTTAPAGNVPDTPPVVTEIGVPVEAAVKPEIDALTLAAEHALPVTSCVKGWLAPRR
jgi:hypothetical protein